MIAEISLEGLYVPSLLLLSFASMACLQALRRALSQLGFYRWVWHTALFDIALFVIVLRLLFLLAVELDLLKWL